MHIVPESPEDRDEIERLLDLAFGPDRAGKTVYRLRQGVAPVAELCSVIRADGELKGSLRFWPIAIGRDRTPALLLGPIAVAPADRGKGYARALIHDGLARARTLGYRIVLLVGDEPYYAQFGFARASALALELPGPVDPARFLGLELEPGALAGLAGMVQRAVPGEARPGASDEGAPRHVLMTCRARRISPDGSCGCSSMVEQKLPKLTTRVRFPSPAPVFPSNSNSDLPRSGKDFPVPFDEGFSATRQ